MANWSKVVLFGDSLTQHSFEPNAGCWGALIADRLQRITDVVVRGFSGYNSRWLKIILPRLFPDSSHTKDVACFVIFVGANDANDPSSPMGQHVPMDEYKTNLIEMVDYLERVGVARNKVILIAPPNYNHDEYVKYCRLLNRTVPVKDCATVGRYASSCVEAADCCRVEALNLFERFSSEKNSAELFCDGLHFSRTGSQMVYELLWPMVEKRVKQATGNDELKMNFPIYSEIDLKNPELTLL